MKHCTDCKHAKWDRTAAGRLHPSGAGQCLYLYRLPPLPASMRWGWFDTAVPAPKGGTINRRKELPDHCAYYARAAGEPAKGEK